MKKLLFVTFAAGTAFSALVYLAACLTPYISPQKFWPFSFLTLGYPYLAAGIFLLITIWFFIRKKACFILLIILLSGYQNLFSTVAVHFLTKPVARPAGTLRILSWNVRGFDNPSTYIDTPGSRRVQMFDYIHDAAPDVICVQEFAEHLGKGMVSNTTELLDLGYSYYFRTDDFVNNYHFGYIASGTAIFSKLPILNSGKVMFDDSSHTEYIGFIDINFQHRPLRIFATHLKSLSLAAKLIDNTSRAKFYGDSTFIYEASEFDKLKIFPMAHARESRIAKSLMNQSPYPVIFCADMNSIPASYAYHVLSNNLQDVFLQRGFGLGTTMDSLPSPLRIDYIMADKKLEVRNYVKSDLHLSDHYPLIADFSWK